MIKSKIRKYSLCEALDKTAALLDEYEAQIIEEFELDSLGDSSEYLHRTGGKIVVEWPDETRNEEGGFEKMVVTTSGLTVYAIYPDDDSHSGYARDVTKLKWGTDVELGKKAITAVANYLYWGYADSWCRRLIDELSVNYKI